MENIYLNLKKQTHELQILLFGSDFRFGVTHVNCFQDLVLSRNSLPILDQRTVSVNSRYEKSKNSTEKGN